MIDGIALGHLRPIDAPRTEVYILARDGVIQCVHRGDWIPVTGTPVYWDGTEGRYYGLFDLIASQVWASR